MVMSEMASAQVVQTYHLHHGCYTDTAHPQTKATGPMQLGRLKSAPVLVDWPQIPCGLRSAVVLVSRDRRLRAREGASRGVDEDGRSDDGRREPPSAGLVATSTPGSSAEQRKEDLLSPFEGLCNKGWLTGVVLE